MKKILLCFCCCGFLCLGRTGEAAAEFLDGDLVFQDSQSAQCRAVQLATGSAYSHVGLILIEQGKPLVCEAVQPVKMTPLKEWMRRGKNNHYVVKRLKERPLWITAESAAHLRQAAAAMLGKNYDALFSWSEDRIYCSELVWKTYQHALNLPLCATKTLQDFNLSHPEVKRILKERYGDKIPYHEKVVSPADLFDSELLVEVAVRNPAS